MVKLIRLATDDIANDTNADITARFNNNLNADLILEPYSQVALLNCALDNLDSEIIITGANNEITWSIGNDQTGIEVLHQVNIPIGQYNNTNYNAFIDFVGKALNTGCTYVNDTNPPLDNVNELGMEWRCILEDRKIQIEYQRGWMAQNAGLYDISGTNIEFYDVAGRPYVRRNGAFEQEDFTECGLFQAELSRGCGFHGCQIAKLVTSPANDYAKNGFVVGLSKTPLYQINTSQFQARNIDYGVKVSITTAGARYTTFHNGNETVSQIVPQYVGENNVGNDWLRVGIDGGRVVVGIYTDGGNGDFQEIDSYEYDGEEQLYPFFAFNSGGNYTRFRWLFTTLSPFNERGLESEEQTALTSDIGFVNLPAVPMTGVVNYVDLYPDVADFMGYNTNFITRISKDEGFSFQWIGENLFNAGNISDSFLVLLDNLQLESYDGLVSQRKNILYTIDSSDDTGKLVYEVPNPIYIDLNNQAPIALRNIRARILNNDYSDIKLLERGFMTILIQKDPTRS